MTFVRRVSPVLEARRMPLYPTAEECSDICDWIAKDLGHSGDQLNGMGVGKDPITGLVQITNPMGKVLIGLGHWVIRNGPNSYSVLHGDHFDSDYEVVEEEPEVTEPTPDIPEEPETPVEPTPEDPEPEKENI